MKPLYLEPDEEITSVIEKVSALSDREIALVGPKNSALFQSLINLKLLAKEAKKLDKELVIIGSNKTSLRLAEQVGLKAFASLGAVSDVPAPSPKKAADAPTTDIEEVVDGVKVNRYQPPVGGEIAPAPIEAVPPTEPTDEVATALKEQPQDEPVPFTPIPLGDAPAAPEAVTLDAEVATTDIDTPTQSKNESEALPAIVSRGYHTHTEFVVPWRSIIAAGILLLVAFVLMIFFLPRAKVTVNFPATPVDQVVTLAANTKGDNSESALPANLLVSQQETNKTIAATGKKDIGAKASGTVTVKNCEDSSPHAIAAGTKLTASSKSFITNSAVTIPAGSFSNGGQTCNSTTVSVGITASEAGDGSNLSGASFVMTGLSGRFTTTGTTSGGSSKQVTVLSQEDVDKAVSEAKTQATEAGTAELMTKAEQQTLLDNATWQTVLSQTVDKKVGDQVEAATLKYVAELSALVFDQATADEKIRQTVSKDISAAQELVIPKDKATILIFKTYNTDKSILTFEAAVHGYIVTKINKTEIAAAVKNKSQRQAEAILADRFNATRSEIIVTPSWWFGRLPLLAAAINVEYGFSDQTAE